MCDMSEMRLTKQQTCLLLLVAACLISAAAAASEPSRQASGPGGMTVNVSNGYELHAALTSTDVDTIVLLQDISQTMDTCPAPHTSQLPPTQRKRPITLMSPPGGPYFYWSCAWMPARLLFTSGTSVTFRHLQLRQCSGPEDLMIFSKAPGAAVILDDVIENMDNICLAAPAASQWYQQQARPAAFGATSPQVLRVADPGTNWCSPGNTAGGVPQLQPYNQTLCSIQALWLQDVAVEMPTTDPAVPSGSWYMVYKNTLQLCPAPLPEECVAAQGVTACAAAAYEKRNPDANRLQAVPDPYQLAELLAAPPEGIRGALLLANISLTLATSPPRGAGDPVPLLDQDFLIRADPRGPRLYVDCGLLTGRVRMAPGRTLTLEHLVLANCSVTSPFSYVTMSPGATMNLTDTLVKPTALCVPLGDKLAEVVHSDRPSSAPGLQRLQPAANGTWCHTNDSGTAWDHNSTSGLQALRPVQPTYILDDAAGDDQQPTQSSELLDAMNWAIPEPASVPYYIHPSWHGSYLCHRSALLLQDVVMAAPVVTLPPSTNTSGTAAQSGQRGHRRLAQQAAPAVPASPGTSDGTYTLIFNNSAWVPCAHPIRNCSNPQDSYGCVARVYALRGWDPDSDAAAVAAGAAQRAGYMEEQQVAASKSKEAASKEAAAGGSQGGRNTGLAVVLPAVLASVVGALCIAALGLLLYRRHHHRHARGAASAGGADQDKLVAPGGYASGGKLLGSARSGGTLSSSGAASSMRDSAASVETPEGIALGVLLGAGSYGRVYKGSWRGQLVAVKVVAHTAAEEAVIGRELKLAAELSHPRLVGLLHAARMAVSGSHAGVQPSSGLPTPTPSDSSSLTLPSGAVGVFSIASAWTLGGPTGHAPVPDMETWMVLELMDRGNLAAAVRHGAFVNPVTREVRQAPLLRRLCDVAAGVAYLHQAVVCHGDLKCENVLLKSDAEDPDGCVAKVADFGLSRALQAGQSHLSTRRYGTVSHMPPELLAQGRLTTAADVYSFGIIMWEVVSCARPYEGLHPGQIIHKVVSQRLRPEPWPPEVPQEYIMVATSCWAQDPDARPAMSDVLTALTSLLALVTAHSSESSGPGSSTTATEAGGAGSSASGGLVGSGSG